MEASVRAEARMRLLKYLVKAEDRLLGTVIEALKPKAAGGLVDLLAVKGTIAAALKAGKVLSSANETAVRTACDHITKAMDHLSGVLDSNADDDEDEAPVDDVAKARARRMREAEGLRIAAHISRS
jgi:hypothetical protein